MVVQTKSKMMHWC